MTAVSAPLRNQYINNIASTTRQAPPTRQEPVEDNYHGDVLVDNYRWLEDAASDETKAWVEAQNRHTADVLGAFPQREALAQRLEELFKVGGVGTPSSYGDSLIYFKRDAEQNQAVLVKRDAEGQETVLIDPNTWSDEGTEAMDWHHVSSEGNYVAYGRSSGGDEWSTLRIIDTRTGQELGDEIGRTRAASLAWLPDESGFFYTRYPEPGSVPPGQEDYNRHVFFHRLGTDAAEDPKIFGEGLDPRSWPNISLSEDGSKLMIMSSHGWTRNDVHVYDVETGETTALIEGVEAQFHGGIGEDGYAYLQTNHNAPKNRVIKVDLNNPGQENWEEVIPEREDAVLQGYDKLGDGFVASYLKDASSQLVRYGADGARTEIDLPGIGSVGSLSVGKNDELYYSFSSYNYPSTVFKMDTQTGETDVWARPEGSVNPEDFEVKQQWFRSVDGEQVPMFIVHKKGLELDGDNPTLLYGYGGFDVSLTPSYSKSTMQFLENGGVYAVANLRGGGEFGADWHEAGMLGQKQNVFDDVISAGQHLVKAGFTNPDKMAVAGGSNGGLLVGAAVTQAPELFEAGVCAVPLLDMLRYDQFGIAQLWIPEYGSAQNETQYAYIADYSPYQNVVDGRDYPATLFMSGAEDSRTDPLHARKMAARMQAAQGDESSPVLIRVEENAGHGQGKPIGKIVEAETDKWSFLYQELGVVPQFPDSQSEKPEG